MKSQIPPVSEAPEGAAKPTREQLAARNAELEAQVAQNRAERDQALKDESVIKEKMEKGLTREQAKSVIQRQREHGEGRQTAYDEARAARLAALKK
jgi:hypothetical protein